MALNANAAEEGLPSLRHLHLRTEHTAVFLKGGTMTAKRLFFWGTIIAGAAAAYLMYRRGEPVGAIAVRTVTNPVGSLVSELETAAG